MSKISLAPNAAGTAIFTIESPGTSTNRTLTLPDDTGTIVTNSGNQAGSFTTLNTSGQVVFNDAGADVDFRVEGDTDANLLVVDASTDRVGIGTSTPGARLHALGADTSQRGQISAQGSSGNAGRITVWNDSAYVGELSTSGSDLRLYTGGILIFSAGSAERARITSGGFFKASNTTYQDVNAPYHELRNSTTDDWVVLVDSTPASDPFGILVRFTGASPNGVSNHFFAAVDSTTTRAQIRSNGGLANYSANNVNLSDARVKKDIENLGSQWNCIKEWNLVEFRYNEQADDVPKNYGVIAQQIQEHCPELIQVFQEAKDAVEAKEAVLDEEGNVVEPAVEAQPAQEERIGVREQQMLWMSIKALQEAMERIETLEASNTALEARIAALETGA